MRVLQTLMTLLLALRADLSLGQSYVLRLDPLVLDKRPLSEIDLGNEVPLNPDKLTVQVRGTVPGRPETLAAVPVYDASSGSFSLCGSIPVGTPVKLDKIKKAGYTMYYSLPFACDSSGKGLVPSTKAYVWVAGYYLELTGRS